MQQGWLNKHSLKDSQTFIVIVLYEGSKVLSYLGDDWRCQLLLHVIKHVLEHTQVTILGSIVTGGFPQLHKTIICKHNHTKRACLQVIITALMTSGRAELAINFLQISRFPFLAAW